MSAHDVKDTIDLAIEKSGVYKVKLRHRPRLLSDNGRTQEIQTLRDIVKKETMQQRR